MNDEVNNQGTGENQDYSSYMPKDDNAQPEQSSAAPEPQAAAPQESTPTDSGYGFERRNPELAWVAQKVNEAARPNFRGHARAVVRHADRDPASTG